MGGSGSGRKQTPIDVVPEKSIKKDPARYRDRYPHEGEPLGKAPDNVNADVWNEVVATAPQGALHKSDRITLELICLALQQIRKLGVEAKITDIKTLHSMLGDIGMNPVSRCKIMPPDKDDEPKPMPYSRQSTQH